MISHDDVHSAIDNVFNEAASKDAKYQAAVNELTEGLAYLKDMSQGKITYSMTKDDYSTRVVTTIPVNEGHVGVRITVDGDVDLQDVFADETFFFSRADVKSALHDLTKKALAEKMLPKPPSCAPNMSP